MIQYTGEHLLPGQAGRILIWISFLAALISFILYLVVLIRKEKKTVYINQLSSYFFFLHVFSLIAVAIILYLIIFRHYFEYTYVWEYSSKGMPLKYIISCFWAGQEGSFLMWAIFQAILGVILICQSKKWENFVMPVISLSQIFMTSMLLGLQFSTFRIGSSPFALLRETYFNFHNSIFTQPDYLKMIPDGNGLNPLLENIWMTIHPPVLFLGYSLMLVPFSYAIAGLVSRKYYSWIRLALPWTLLTLLVLGAGLLLGGAWAYVSLTFGGFWAWDPVENSSLVPWLVLIAGLHFMLISRKQNYALFLAFLFTGFSYILVLYASFLTRSGLLANTSAHSFGNNGMTGQLVSFFLSFLALLVVLLASKKSKFSRKRKDILLSREFWMLTGAIIIVLSAFQIIFTTSIPVINRLFHSVFTTPVSNTAFYNQWQLPFVLLIAGLIAFTQFLNYHENSGRTFFKKLIIPFLITAFILLIIILSGIVSRPDYIMLLAFLVFSVCASLYNLLFRRTPSHSTGSIITHTGFSVFIIGVLITFSNSEIISGNTSRFDLGTIKANTENQLLMRNDTVYTGGFYLVYSGQIQHGNLTEYKVDFLNRKAGKCYHEFTLYPSINRNPRMGNVYNPATKHDLMRDYYIYISSVGSAPDYIVVKAIMNPWINVLWMGAGIMLLGFLYSQISRWKSGTKHE